MYSKEEIRKLLNDGRNSSVEFKASHAKPHALAKEIVAFSNTHGGFILLGVNGDGSISGLDDRSEWEARIADIAQNHVIPPVHLAYSEVVVDDQPIGVVKVPKGKEKPYQTATYRILIRVGPSNRTVTKEEFVRLFQECGLFQYDFVAVERTAAADLNLDKIHQYLSRHDIDFVHEGEAGKRSLLKNSEILHEDGKVTLAGLLVFGLNPQQYLPNARIAFTHFKGSDTDSEIIWAQTIEGSIDSQVDAALTVIKQSMLRTFDHSNYLPNVFRELLVNACVHRDYAISRAQIRVYLFEDRLEFISPGMLPNSLTVEKLKTGVSYAVNPVIVKFMGNLRYMSTLGRGIPAVCKEVEKNAKHIEFKELGEEFKVTLFF
ncbi:MAG: RNA-binding domain-containing protein [Candidatus Omnitrophota bacterium]